MAQPLHVRARARRSIQTSTVAEERTTLLPRVKARRGRQTTPLSSKVRVLTLTVMLMMTLLVRTPVTEIRLRVTKLYFARNLNQMLI